MTALLAGGRLGLALALLVVVALVGGSVVLGRVLSGGEDHGGSASPGGRSQGSGSSITTSPGSTANTAPPSSAAPSTTAPESTQPGQGTPAGWVGFRREAGAYGLAYPPGWRLSTSGGNNDTDVRGPGGLLFRVQSSDRPSDPMEAWTQLEHAFARSHAAQDYRRIAFGRGSYGGLDAVVWEFSYRLGGQRVRARDVTFKSASGRWGYAVLFQAPERRWDEAQSTAAGFERAFTVLG